MCHQLEILHHNKLIHWSNWMSVLSIRFSCRDGAITLWFKDVLKSLARHWPSSLGWRSVNSWCDSARNVMIKSWTLSFVSIVVQLVICSCLASAVWWSSFVVEVHHDELVQDDVSGWDDTILLSSSLQDFIGIVSLLLHGGIVCWVRDCMTLSCHFDIIW